MFKDNRKNKNKLRMANFSNFMSRGEFGESQLRHEEGSIEVHECDVSVIYTMKKQGFLQNREKERAANIELWHGRTHSHWSLSPGNEYNNQLLRSTLICGPISRMGEKHVRAQDALNSIQSWQFEKKQQLSKGSHTLPSMVTARRLTFLRWSRRGRRASERERERGSLRSSRWIAHLFPCFLWVWPARSVLLSSCVSPWCAMVFL